MTDDRVSSFKFQRFGISLLGSSLVVILDQASKSFMIELWLTIAIVGVLLVWLWKAKRVVDRAAISLIIGGALGNLIDRIRVGAVTDFLDFYLGPYHWPAFNLADTGIFIGTGLILIQSFYPADERR